MFFFGYDVDVMRRLVDGGLRGLGEGVEGEYFWNGYIMRWFREVGVEGVVLLLM